MSLMSIILMIYSFLNPNYNITGYTSNLTGLGNNTLYQAIHYYVIPFGSSVVLFTILISIEMMAVAAQAGYARLILVAAILMTSVIFFSVILSPIMLVFGLVCAFIISTILYKAFVPE